MNLKRLWKMALAGALAAGGGWIFSSSFLADRASSLRTPLKDALVAGQLGAGFSYFVAYGALLCLGSGALVGVFAFASLDSFRGPQTPRQKGALAAFLAAMALGAAGPLASSWWRGVALMAPLENLPVALVVAFSLASIATLLLLPEEAGAFVEQLGLAPAVGCGLTGGAVMSVGLEPMLLEALAFGQRNRADWGLYVLSALTLLGVLLPAAFLLVLLLKGRLLRSLAPRLFSSAVLFASAVMIALRVAPKGDEWVACDLGQLNVGLSLGVAGVGLALAALVFSHEAKAARWAGQAMALVAAVGLLTAFSHSSATSCTRKGMERELEWALNDEPGAVSKGKAQSRPVALYFGAEWCEPCQRMGATTLVNPSVVDLLYGYVIMRLDYTEDWPGGEDVKKKYGVESLPTVVFISSDGHVSQEKIVGYVEADEFLRVASLVH